MAVAALLLGHRLGEAPFDDPGEGMHAEIARELAHDGDPFALTLSGVRYVDKPPLLYVLIALTFGVVGPSEFAARLVPVLAALIAVGATAWCGARLLGAGAGLLAGLGLLTSVGFFAYGRYVRPDALFVAALAGGFALVGVGLAENRRRMVGWGIVTFGLAALAKDPLGLLAPLGVVLLALVLTGGPRSVRRAIPVWGLAVAGLLAFGWWIGEEMRSPGFVWYTVIDNHVRNVARARLFPDEDVPLTAVQFLAVASLGAVPWALGALVAVIALARARAWRDGKELPWVILALWALGVFAGTALSPFRLPHYGLPAYPALALLAARAWRETRSRRFALVHAAVLAAGAAACFVAWLSGGEVFMTQIMETTDVASRKTAVVGQANPLPPWEALQPRLGQAAAVLGASAVATAVVIMRSSLGPGAAAVPVTLAMLALMPFVSDGLSLMASHRGVRPLGLQLQRLAGPDDIVAHEGPLENSGALEWYSSRRPVIIDGRRSVLGFGSTLPGHRDAFWDAETARAHWGSARRLWIVTTRDPAHSVVARLPDARVVATAGGRWLYVSAEPPGASKSSTVVKP